MDTQTTLPFEQIAELSNSIDDPRVWVWPVAVTVLLVGLGILLVYLKRRRDRRELEPDLRVGDQSELTHAPATVQPGATVPPVPLPPGDIDGNFVSGAMPLVPDGVSDSPPPSSEMSTQPAPVAKPVSTAAPADVPPPPAKARVIEESPVDDIKAVDQKAWLKKLRRGLSRTRDTLLDSLGGLFFGKAKLAGETLEKLHEALYRADVGVKTTDTLIGQVCADLGSSEARDWESVKCALKKHISAILAKPDQPLIQPTQGPWVVLVVGVNGVGKTTTIGKLGAHFAAQGKTTLFCAADTFRAAAIDQLQIWGDRIGAQVIKHKPGSDPAAVAFDGVKAAKARGADVLLIDTAGRLHNKDELMAQLEKVKRIAGRELPGAPHETWLVLDATTGQNAVMQVKAFLELVAITGIVVTKLDGTAKGGVLIGIADQFQIPIRYIGVGEKASDLRAFSADEYTEFLFD